MGRIGASAQGRDRGEGASGERVGEGVLFGRSPEAADAMGLAAGTPVVAGAGDVASMAVGTGSVREHDVHLGIGTSAWLASHVPSRRRELRSYIGSICSAPS